MSNAKKAQRNKGSGRHPNSMANLRKWKPGESGNPRGMDPGIAHVRELARQFTPEAIETLVEIMGDTDATKAARVAAANALLDRGWGKPDQSVSIDGGQSLLSILDELEKRRDMRDATVLEHDNDAQPGSDSGDNQASGMLIEHERK